MTSVAEEARHLAVAARSPRLVTAAFEHRVTLWNLGVSEPIGSFDTVLDDGGHRLALSDDGRVIVAAAYHREGVVAYDEHGVRRWMRKDIKRTQRLSVSHSSEALYVGRESQPCMIVSLEDGSTIGTIRAAQGVVESLHDRIAFVDQPRLAVVTVPSMTRLFQFERTTFGVLAATFSHDALVVSESGGPVRCLEVPSGRLRWQFQPDAGSHCLDVTYAASQDAFYAVVWSYQEGGDKHLVRLEPSRGDAVRVKSLGCPAETCFWPSRSCLVTSLGAIVDLATLESRCALPLGAAARA